MNIEKEYVDGLLRKIERLQQERDALAAQIEAFKKIRSDWGGMAINDAKTLIAFIQLAGKAPQQCLRDVQAEAILKFAKYIAETGELNFGDSNLILSEGFTYSQSVRQGGV